MREKKERPRILLVWGYYRIGWIEPFIKLKDDFEFSFINFISKEQETVLDFDFPRYYWSEFKNAQELLKKVQPDAIVFMQINTTYPISLNIIAKKNDIPTFIMQHGLYSGLSTYLNLEKKNPTHRLKINTTSKPVNFKESKKDTMFFLLKSLKVWNLLKHIKIIIYIKYSRKFGLHHAMFKYRFEARMPSRYIGFTHFNMRSIYERDGANPDKTLLIGNPYYDEYFHNMDNIAYEKYFLLIDQPLAENQFVDYGISKSQVNVFYQKLNMYALSQSSKLYIKLHPENYNSDFMVKDPNIVYVRDSKLAPLILNSQGCFGCPSTLIIPCLYLKPSILFYVPNLSVDHDFEQYNICKVYDYNSFEPTDISFEVDLNRRNDIRLFEERYFYKADGKATERLSMILRNAHDYVSH